MLKSGKLWPFCAEYVLRQICTEILYQPLTALDCLHTFCGSCLKEWFSWQASQISSTEQNPYTCPSCRASVRETRPNATVTTLLDMYLQANPAKGRSQQEKDEAKERYTAGEQVLPRIERVRRTSVEEEDRRMIEEVRQMSLREVGVGSSESHLRSSTNRDSDRHRESRADETRRQRRRDHDRRRRENTSAASNQVTSTSAHETMDPGTRARQLEHQSSLRSLISSSDFDTSEIDEEVLRHVIDEILQDGLDLDNLTAVQEDELTDRIANALRQGRRPGSDNTRPSQSRESNHSARRSERDSTIGRQNQTSSSTVGQTGQSSRPPVSSRHLSTAYPVNHGSRQATSSDHRRQTSPAIIPSSGRSSELRGSATTAATSPSNPTRASSDQQHHSPSSRRGVSARASPARAFPEVHRQAARSSTDLPNPLSSSPPERTHSLDTIDRRRNQSDQGRQGEDDPRGTRTQSPRRINTGMDLVTDLNPRNANVPPLPVASAAATVASSTPPHVHGIGATSPDGYRPPYPLSDLENMTQIPSSSTTYVPTEQPRGTDLLISCNRCKKPNLEQEFHMNCSLCLLGKYNLCLRCYLRGLGCLHWFGFGYAATQRYERQMVLNAHSANHTPPHILVGHRYIPMHQENNGAVGGELADETATVNNRILQSGVFCSKCAEFADQCFWKCDSCNEGEWGFCNRCVNQGKCCSHPLLPIAHTSTQPSRDSTSSTHHTQLSLKPIINVDSTSSSQPRNTFPGGSYEALTFSRKCQICKYPISPSNTHFHCPQCNDGEYDICTACYLNMTLNSKISQENGAKGWRRCPNFHRMIVVGFEDSLTGQRRVIVNDLVGGHAWKDDVPDSALPDQPKAIGEEEFTWRDGQLTQIRTITRRSVPASPRTLQKFPPDGGVGLRTLALWSYWPEPEAADELEFPKGAIVSEVENINGDWFWGVYAGAKGLFPGNYVRILEDRSA